MRLEQTVFGLSFRNPVLLAAGTCGFGREVAEVIDLSAVGGLVTKSVTLEPRAGNPSPRVAGVDGGMMNSIGLTNPGAPAVRHDVLPWLEANLSGTPVFVSVAGHSPEEYAEIVSLLDDGPGFQAWELNLSCPNDTRLGGQPFALDPEAAAGVTARVRGLTDRPLVAKLAPNAPDLAAVVKAVEEAGADGFTLVNTMPGLALDPLTGRPALGAGVGGVSGPAIRAMGVRAVWTASQVTDLPLVGVGGIAGGGDAVQYLRAGASLVQVGSASFWDPRSEGRVRKELARLGRQMGLSSVDELTGKVEGLAG
ncbi:MAG: dihydroorotate dehydrogenase [Gemmatimonadales bacterium]|nr:MAG: dihydroorotate dehydrogenase [Gemmatimonadales bacterium]